MADESPESPESDAGPPALSGTTLPALPRKTGRPRWPLAAGLLALVVLVAVVLAFTQRGGGSGSVSTAPASRAPVIADSGRTLGDTLDVQSEAKALLAGSLAPGRVTLASASPEPSATLGSSLALQDPALPGCVSALAAGGSLLGVDKVTYRGQPALVVVVSGDKPSQALAYVIGPACSTPGAEGIRTIVTVAR